MKEITETWTGIGIRVEQTERQRVSPEGFPMMKPDGSPDMEPLLILGFVHEGPGETWVVRVPFDEEGKAKLMQTLTGGVVVVPGVSDLPPGMKLQ